jgi:hypothetical protein
MAGRVSVYVKGTTGVIGTVIRAVGKPDPVVDIGTRHMACEDNVVEDNEIYGRIISVKVNGGGQRF